MNKIIWIIIAIIVIGGGILGYMKYNKNVAGLDCSKYLNVTQEQWDQGTARSDAGRGTLEDQKMITCFAQNLVNGYYNENSPHPR
ncbi:hypothetical protein A3A03_01960 [Candidatus Nomurabacteria bacterium RIFCSPLOWO2_01_FULL_40_18]|uniref:Uncharacterized protein n=1 Tax=Candidatus Nomurabacteria bacterium RIFCSPLOWO2_01_FULL_40_18 TaxID=1801773 RepID=A0A1F6XIS1_9BACT|nr:MAG: hypothetical protein A3A03_01960 [Candidatus Nomurabacteria bacterium RIFCSPLOWO2_01_FULL_40_18]